MSQRVPFGGRRPLDPRRSNVSIDGNVLNRGSDEADRRIDRLLRLSNEGVINFVIGGGIRDEVLHPATPDEKKSVVVPQIFNLRPGRNRQQEADRRAVAAILQGNSKPETHAADASHLSEAAEAGCAYFLTGDARILRKRAELAGVLAKAIPLPIAATIALAMIGPMPGTVINCRQLALEVDVAGSEVLAAQVCRAQEENCGFG